MRLAALAPGSLIGVIAPAGPCPPERLTRVPALYAAHGYRARLYPSCHAHDGYLAGDDSLRLTDLHAALADDSVAALHCLRGGYGSMRLLDGVDLALVRRARKLLVGYSDITALHALWRRAGVASLHAPMAASDLVVDGPGVPGPASGAAAHAQAHAGAGADADAGADDDADADAGADADARALFGLLRTGCAAGDRLAPALDRAPRAAGLHGAGSAEGRLVGGNLSIVAALLGTPWAWPPDGAVLFLEDIGESLYRVDRLLTQLRLAGVLHAVRGFLIGSFTNAEPPWPLLRDMLLPLGKPLLAGWPAGHGRPNLPLPLGLPVRLDADAGRLTLWPGAPLRPAASRRRSAA